MFFEMFLFVYERNVPLHITPTKSYLWDKNYRSINMYVMIAIIAKWIGKPSLFRPKIISLFYTYIYMYL